MEIHEMIRQEIKTQGDSSKETENSKTLNFSFFKLSQQIFTNLDWSTKSQDLFLREIYLSSERKIRA